MQLDLDDAVSPADWDGLNDASPAGSPFCATWFAEAVGAPADRWAVRDAGGRIVLGALVARDGDDVARQPLPFTMYQGLLPSPALAALAPHRRGPAFLEAAGALLAALAARYDRISFSLHHAVDDVRAFLWFNYHESAAGRFQVVPRYTGLIDLAPGRSWDSVVAGFRENRRRDLAKAEAAGCSVVPWSDIDTVLALQRMTFARQDLDLPEATSALARRIVAAVLARDAGGVLAGLGADGHPQSATVFLRHGATGYYLIGATDPQARAQGIGTLLFVEHMRRLRDAGVATVDVCGINSPNRGDFKTSFNAVPRVYFDVEWTRPSPPVAA